MAKHALKILWREILRCSVVFQRYQWKGFEYSQLRFACSNLTMETLEKGVKYVQS